VQIEIEKIIQKLALCEYAPEYGEQVLHVWVNPPRKLLQARIAEAERGQALTLEMNLLKKAKTDAAIENLRLILVEVGEIGRASLVWMADILSQGPDETRMSAEELRTFSDACDELDPRFYPWIVKRVWDMIVEYRAVKKKA